MLHSLLMIDALLLKDERNIFIDALLKMAFRTPLENFVSGMVEMLPRNGTKQ